MAIKNRVIAVEVEQDYKGGVTMYTPLPYVELTQKQTKNLIKRLQAQLIEAKKVTE